jgi:FixJ family two-component response regulator
MTGVEVDAMTAREADSIVFVVDDDPSFRRSAERLIHLAGFKVQAFGSAREFLAAKRLDGPSCLVLDVRMPGLSGLDLQRELAKAGIMIPIIFVTGHGDIPMSVQAMKAGAVEFLTKPFRDKKLLDAIEQALERDRAARERQATLAGLRRYYELLTPREREVMAHVVSGMLNKQIAANLNTVEKTIKFHRAHIMEKMQAGSLAELVRMAGDLGLSPPRT